MSNDFGILNTDTGIQLYMYGIHAGLCKCIHVDFNLAEIKITSYHMETTFRNKLLQNDLTSLSSSATLYV